MWALDNGENQVYLPKWISDVLELRLCQFCTSYQAWQNRIAKRAQSGKSLTKTQQDRFDVWKLNNEPKYVFSKDRKKQVFEARHVKDGDAIALQLHLSDDPESLQVSTSSAARYRLRLLTSDKADVPETIPEALEGPVPLGMIPAAGDTDPATDAESGEEIADVEVSEETAACLAADEAYEAEFGNGKSEESDDGVEILAESDDDLTALDLPGKVKRVKAFHMRDAWKQLESANLLHLPLHIVGCSIAFHSTISQWQGYYPHTHTGLTFSFGGRTHRSEKEALLRVARGMLQAHLGTCPKDPRCVCQLLRRHVYVWTKTRICMLQ